MDERRKPPPIVGTIRMAGFSIAAAVCVWAGVQVWMQRAMLEAVNNMKAAAPDTVRMPMGDTTNCHPHDEIDWGNLPL